MINDIIDYLTLQYLVDPTFEAPVGRRIKVAFLMAKKAYNKMSQEERRALSVRISMERD
jgi:hypothetical protein